VTGIDWPARNLIEIVYHLYSFKQRHQIVLKVGPIVPGLPCRRCRECGRQPIGLEREVFDMLGR